MTTRASISRLLGVFALLAGSSGYAQLAPLKQSVAPSTADDLASRSVQTELTGDHQKALQIADDAIKTDPSNPWGRYAKGDALGSLQRVDDAAAAFREAEQHFTDAEVWGKSIAIWGQANALRQVGRCQDASPIYERYASFVEKLDKDAAALARKFEKYCTPASSPPR
jgi:tetratricopeptide (TPR) repeat protein